MSQTKVEQGSIMKLNTLLEVLGQLPSDDPLDFGEDVQLVIANRTPLEQDEGTRVIRSTFYFRGLLSVQGGIEVPVYDSTGEVNMAIIYTFENRINDVLMSEATVFAHSADWKVVRGDSKETGGPYISVPIVDVGTDSEVRLYIL